MSWTMFCMALLGVLLMEVFAVLSVGFWLSFGAVFSLLYAFSARPFMLLDTSVFTRVMQAVRDTVGCDTWHDAPGCYFYCISFP